MQNPENANKDLTSFTYVSSHDLQEPLRKIQNFVACLMNEEKNLSDDGKYYLQRTYQTAQRMQALIEDLLIYSRTKSTERKFEKLDLNKILEEVKKSFTEELYNKNAEIRTNDLCEVNIIQFQFIQLFQNLISNSLKFSRPEIKPLITINSTIIKGSTLDMKELLSNTDYCHMIYTDNGIGFASEYNERIFEVFQRLHTKEEYKGTGMGLAICKRIVENHNGLMTATGELNKGVRFDIYIPV